jgi:hypothetical protein
MFIIILKLDLQLVRLAVAAADIQKVVGSTVIAGHPDGRKQNLDREDADESGRQNLDFLAWKLVTVY